ncbi:S8 family peptidase [Geojedonia litorea]|uniref:S8 family peptidase n=1 Tax=Geojedonia litorea TaxID=1268269 RepID=A0ABV9N5G0_9FLAO
MKIILKPIVFLCIALLTLDSCKSTSVISTPIEAIDNIPLKVSELTEDELKVWGHLDLAKDTIPGMSLDKAYNDIIKNKKGETTIVAVIDTGIDIDHEDLNEVIWTNQGEIPNNGKDDDQNGYVDDIHGWNFLGDAYEEQLEYVRLLASGDTANPRYKEAQAEYEQEYQKNLNLKTQFEQIYQVIKNADEEISKHLGKKIYTKEEVDAIVPKTQAMSQSVYMVQQTFAFGVESVTEALEAIKSDLNELNKTLNYNLNKDFNGRTTGDDVNNIADTNYGNNNVKPTGEGETHGTHVAGIIAAQRDNNIGAKGVANNVKIMSLRVVSNGDEYDKDVALAIRYAADNGAKVVNMSFGKYYSPHSEWVRDAIVYAAKKDVLLVTGAGNESLDLDIKSNFPNDQINNGPEISDNYLSVGALNPKYGAEMVADYSNYGKINVDVFAPGSNIYSTFPNNNYESISGTSMACPGVAGVAALIRSQYPHLTASQVKHIIMSSGLTLTTKVIVGGNSNEVKPLNELSKSGKIVNAYNALIMASKQ